jgi:hypothetical protein
VKHCILAIGWLAILGSAWVLAQDDPRVVESRFHRVHLRNGNVVDGQLLLHTSSVVVLRLASGEISFKADSVEYIEFIKMKTFNDGAIILPAPKPTDRPPTSVRPPPSVRTPPTEAKSVKLDPRTEAEVEELLSKYAKVDVEQKGAILHKLIQMGDQVPAYILDNLGRFDREQAPFILNTLAATKDASLVGPMMRLLNATEDPTSRINLAMALGVVGDPSGAPSLYPLLKDKDPQVRTAAVMAVSLLNVPDSFDFLLPLVSDPDREARTRAIGTLNDWASKHGRRRELGDALASGISSAKPDVRLDLIYAIGHGGYQSQWNSLAPLLQEDDPGIRQAAASALAELSVTDSGGAVLAAVAAEKIPAVRAALAVAVQKLNLMAAGGSLIEWLDTTGPDAKAPITQALASLAGQNYGSDLAKWRAWWEKAQPK